MRRFFLALLTVMVLAILAGCTTPAQPTESTVPSSAPTDAPTEPPLSGWQTQDGHTLYYISGIPHTGWLEEDGCRYYFDEQGYLHTGWLQLEDGKFYLTESGTLCGWQEVDGAVRYFDENGALGSGFISEEGTLYYLTEDGTLTSGWLTLGEDRYYLLENGAVHTGWLTYEENRYYFRADGRMARGRVTFSEEETRYFTSTGAEVILVNPWNFVPKDYEVELVQYSSRYQVAKEIYEPLKKMLADCKAAGFTALVGSAYRTHEYQEGLFERKIQRVMAAEGCTRDEAIVIAATVVAYPGTSEHQLGLAVDLVDIKYQVLDENQENTDAQKWLMEHCWEYGFILRYPNEKSDSTGIIYEPWHYRYVGTELAKELHDLGLCLEEYLEMLTQE